MNHSVITRNLQRLSKVTVANGTYKAVLFALASRTKADGKAWPSVERIAQDSGVSVRHIKRIIGTLEDSGVLSVARKQVRPGQNQSNRYQMYPGMGTQPQRNGETKVVDVVAQEK